MGEEAKQEQPVTEEKKEEKEAVEGEEDKKKEDEAPKPPPPFVLYVDLHCVGCAKKIERSIMKIRGVEGVVIDMKQNQVSIKGVLVEPQAICNMIMKKTKRKPKVLSPLPTNEGDPILLPQLFTSQVSGLVTVELNVNMHCEACAEQLKKKILKMRGVQTAETELSSGKVTVTGTMDANKLVDYVYRRTKKTARIVPQPEPKNPPEEPKPEPDNPIEEPEPDKPIEEPKPVEEEKKEENNNADHQPPNEGGDDQKPPEEAPKEGGGGEGENKEEPPQMEEGSGSEGGGDGGVMMNAAAINVEEESMKRMMYYYNYQPLYVIERIPPPQLFSDENPNACCIS